MHAPNLISPEYLEEQRRLHADPRGYGTKGHKWADLAASVRAGYGCETVLDYGCGQGALGLELERRGIRVLNYDPAVERFAAIPVAADLVICTDVLEHVEPDKVEAVIEDLALVTTMALLLVVSMVPTSKTLSDGRQAHISLHPPAWWKARLDLYFRQTEVHTIQPEKQWVAVFLKKRPA